MGWKIIGMELGSTTTKNSIDKDLYEYIYFYCVFYFINCGDFFFDLKSHLIDNFLGNDNTILSQII